jgi:hypothetical protein
MATARLPWSVPGVILFSQGELSYEVDLSRGLVEDLAQSQLGERTFLAWERTAAKHIRSVIVRSVPPTSPRDPRALDRMRARLREEARLATYLQHPRIARIFEIHEDQGGLYVVSEVDEGTSINTLISYSPSALSRNDPGLLSKSGPGEDHEGPGRLGDRKPGAGAPAEHPSAVAKARSAPRTA